jgi:hypothetical protein
MRSIFKRLLRRHTAVVAYVALFAALGGSAYAMVAVTGKHQERDDHRQGRQQPFARHAGTDREGSRLPDGPARTGRRLRR